MSYRYLLDTNILSDLIRNPQGQASQHLKRIKPQTICTSILVACELSFGAQKRNAPALSDRISSLLDRIPVLPLDLPAHQYYSTLRCTLEKQGTPIGSMDLLIAAHALSLNLTLVTHNTREFSRVPNLSLENWLN